MLLAIGVVKYTAATFNRTAAPKSGQAFNPTVTIKYSISSVVVDEIFRPLQLVTLKVYDQLSNEVKTREL